MATIVQVPPQSIARHACLDYEGPNKGGVNVPFNDHFKHDFPYASTISNKTTGRHASCPVSPPSLTRCRASSPPLSDTGPNDSSDDDINAPVTPPPVIKSLSRYVQRAKTQHKPYERGDPSTLHRRYAATQLSPIDSRLMPDVNKGKVLLESRLKHLSSEALAQAVITKQANVEWRRVRALATAWEIQAIEEHKRFLLMVLEDDSDTYASAASEPWSTSLQELSKGSVDELDERLHFCTAAYSPDVTSFAIGDKQLDLVEDIAHMHLDDYTAECRLLNIAGSDDSEDRISSRKPTDQLSKVYAKSNYI